MRLPTPARRAWSIRRAFSGAVDCGRAARSSASVSDRGVEAERTLRRVELDAAEPAGVAHAQVAAVGEAVRRSGPTVWSDWFDE